MIDQLTDDVNHLHGGGNIALARQYRKMANALKVISTWASFQDGEALTPNETFALCHKALSRFRPVGRQRKK